MTNEAERKMSPSEVVDFIENKVQIDVRFLSAEEIVKTTEVFDRAIELIEGAEQLEIDNALYRQENRVLQEELEKAHDEAVKDFAHFLIDKAKDGSIDICDLTDLVVEWGKQTSSGKEPDKNKADFVEVVRCKDCFEWDNDEGECSHWYGMKENCYCSYGHRKEGANNG